MQSKFFIIAVAVLFFLPVSAGAQEPQRVIRRMLEQLDKYRSFSYEEKTVSWLPGEKEQDGKVQQNHCLEVVDVHEPYVGARFVKTHEDGSFFAYDGKKRLRDTPEPLVFEVDSLFKGITEYRVVPRPFFQVAKTIGQYILASTDSMQVELLEEEQSYQVKLSIFTDEQVEFTMGRLSPYIPEVPEAGVFFTPPHVYMLDIDKSSYMPVAYYRILDHDSSHTQVSDVKFDTQDLQGFDIYNYLPKDFTFLLPESRRVVADKLKKGDSAPDFELQDTEGKWHRLSQYRGQAVLVEFTSVACSVCQIVPTFLHQLSDEFPQVQILSIEAWNMKPSTCANWVKRKGVTHPYLLNGKDIQPLFTDNPAVPVFFLIDAEGKVVAQFTGYGEKTTPTAIREVLKQLK